MKQRPSGSRTLLLSVLMSAPGPLVMGLGLLSGQSTTQIADFVRRSAELLAILMAWLTYPLTVSEENPARKQQVEKATNLFTGAMMCLGGSIMLVLAILSENTHKGNVLPGFVIAALGVTANTIFWRKYTRLNRAQPNPILAVQARLYRAKSLVDGCVTAALLSVILLPGSPISNWLDKAGSLVVAAYLVLCGLQTIREKLAITVGNA